MALVDLWLNDRTQIFGKHVQQVIAFAGDGKLADGSPASIEFRNFLKTIPSDLLPRYVLPRYANDCLQDSFQNSGFALQDIVNEIGRRLDFRVMHGRYRGTSHPPGQDGVWADGNRHSIVVEVKTTDTYRIDLGRISGCDSVRHISNTRLFRTTLLGKAPPTFKRRKEPGYGIHHS